jgi:hypothetical protein
MPNVPSDRRAIVIALATMLGGAPLTASSQAATAGAPAVASPDSVCALPSFRRFDYWAGDWVVSDSTGKTIGRNRVTRDVGGCALHEHWASAGGGIGESFTAYSPNDGKWHQLYVGSGGYNFVMSGSFDGDRLVLFTAPRPSSRDPKVQVIERWTWTPIDPTHVRQRAESSVDGGTTWRTIFNGIYGRAAASASQ